MKKKQRNAAPAAFTDVIATAIDPRLFRRLEALCIAAISYSSNHPEVRAAVAAVNCTMRVDSNQRHGYDTVDCQALTQLLRRTDPDKPHTHVGPAPVRDPIDVLEKCGDLDPSQVSAAEVIRTVKKAFGRCLAISGRGYERSGGGMRRATALQPLDVMGDEVWNIFKQVYEPWLDATRGQSVNAKVGRVSVVKLVFDVVESEWFPEDLDRVHRLDAGTTLKVLQTQLSRFFDPYDMTAKKDGNSNDSMLNGKGRLPKPVYQEAA